MTASAYVRQPDAGDRATFLAAVSGHEHRGYRCAGLKAVTRHAFGQSHWRIGAASARKGTHRAISRSVDAGGIMSAGRFSHAEGRVPLRCNSVSPGFLPNATATVAANTVMFVK